MTLPSIEPMPPVADRLVTEYELEPQFTEVTRPFW
jgi:hypothetical protein